MKRIRTGYKILRNIIFTIILSIIAIYLCLYIALSVPAVQNYIKNIAENELSSLLGGKVEINRLYIYPFNQIVADDVEIISPEGEVIARVDRLGAGINLWRLTTKKKLVFTYAEIIGLSAHLNQKNADEPLNIQYIIDALKSKDPSKPPTKFEFAINSVILRKINLTYDRQWIQRNPDSDRFDPNHISIQNLRADLSLPEIKNDDFKIDLRNLSLFEKSGFTIKSFRGIFHISNEELSVKNMELHLPKSIVKPNDISLKINGLKNLSNALDNERLFLALNDNNITLSDFKAFVPLFKDFNDAINLNIEISGNKSKIDIKKLSANVNSGNLNLSLNGYISNLTDSIIDNINVDIENIIFNAKSAEISNISAVYPAMSAKTNNILEKLGDVNFYGSCEGSLKKLSLSGSLTTEMGKLGIDAEYLHENQVKNVVGSIIVNNIDLNKLMNSSDFGSLSAESYFDIYSLNKRFWGSVDLDVLNANFKGYDYKNLTAHIDLSDKGDVDIEASMEDTNINFLIDGQYVSTQTGKNIVANVEIDKFKPNTLNLWKKYEDYNLSGFMNLDLEMFSSGYIDGELDIKSLKFANGKKDLNFGDINLSATTDEKYQQIQLKSNFVDGRIDGVYDIKNLILASKNTLNRLISGVDENNNSDSSFRDQYNQELEYSFVIKENNELTQFFNLPIRVIYDIYINGKFNHDSGLADFSLNAPYIQQGKDKLIRNSNISVHVDALNQSCLADISTIIPGKNGDITLMMATNSEKNKINTDISWIFDRKRSFKGLVSLTTEINKRLNDNKLAVDVTVNPSTFEINDTIWHIEPAHISYSDKVVEVKNIKVWQDKQFVFVNGKASDSAEDELKILLNDMSLDYVFESLNINHVKFGGVASGEVVASNLFSKAPQLYVPKLNVSNFTYNKGLLGDAVITSQWNNKEKSVDIKADVNDRNKFGAKIDGQIWVTKDSLSFDFDANKVNISFMQPFMEAFCGDVKGRATGKVKLFGTFKEIDLTGDVFADTISMKLDFTNTYYSGSDSVFMSPGLIDIPDFTLHDKFGNTAKLQGNVRHKFFKQPSFDFVLSDAKNLLCYDTNEKMGKNWYGTIYGNGGATVSGYPGFVEIVVRMTTAPKSVFTFVLSDTEEADDYEFMTFTDRKKEEALKVKEEKNKLPDFVERFKKKIQDQQWKTTMKMDLEVEATQDAQMILVMDPIAGDKIKGFGSGNIQFSYNTSSNDMSMYGVYSLEKGNYNFTLQDIFIKEFKIRDGSSISFIGNPLAAVLDIDAIYRVNTNLSDLDKSFLNDKDLNRTNVPVEAVLHVDGDMRNPNISFDIELPTLTQDVIRKVKSIISTEDMMSRQIIYLLALNRFYTPEYMGSAGNNNELASVASSTISSQLSSMLGQLSDKFSFSPYFRTDKGDFSDMEVDLALSSTLLNNRLLLNGNFGYRDRSTSNTTFVGDFDIEYLLNPKGTLRLKAYNHFNDQNYYLKSALTTQGVGIIFKHDFDKWFGFLRRKQKNEKKDTIIQDKKIELDSINIVKERVE